MSQGCVSVWKVYELSPLCFQFVLLQVRSRLSRPIQRSCLSLTSLHLGYVVGADTETMPGKTAPVNAKLAQVPTVQIDLNGTFKYILCKIYEGNKTTECKYIVRGSAGAGFHSDIYDDLDAMLEADDIICECVGGGKITHNAEEKTITVFGKSQGYGAANHATTASLLETCYPSYSITWSD